jgi:hypothetical protein
MCLESCIYQISYQGIMILNISYNVQKVSKFVKLLMQLKYIDKCHALNSI